MKKQLIAITMALTMMILGTPALALEYSIAAPEGGLFASATSVDPMIVLGGGVTENSNIDRSKNAAVMPPAFGSPESYLEGTGNKLIPQAGSGASVNVNPAYDGTGIISSSDTVYVPQAEADLPPTANISVSTNLFTLPDGLYYSDGSIGKLEIPALGLNVRVFEDESLENLSKGVGHFKSTSCWDGNIGLAGHNRGVTTYFGRIHTLNSGDKITYTTMLGTRTYQVFYVGQIVETDFTRLGRSSENLITLVTCVANVPTMRWCVQAKEIH